MATALQLTGKSDILSLLEVLTGLTSRNQRCGLLHSSHIQCRRLVELIK